MKITYTGKVMKLEEVKPGQVFRRWEANSQKNLETMIKVKAVRDNAIRSNVVNLETGELHYWGDGILVEVPVYSECVTRWK